MIHLRLYENFQSYQEIADICQKYRIQNWSINSEGLLDVDGNIYLNSKELDKIPLKFGRVTGNFDCSNNNLTSLEGGPKHVGGHFNCKNNKLVSLEGSPRYVGNTFNCYFNKLTSLEGSPKHVGGNFGCRYNELVSLEGVPDFVSGNFECIGNLIYRIWKLFEDYSKIELFNYYDIVRELNGKPAIVLSRLNQFLDDIGKKPVEKVEGYINL